MRTRLKRNHKKVPSLPLKNVILDFFSKFISLVGDFPIWKVQIREMKYFNLIRYCNPNTGEKKELRILDDLLAGWEDIGQILCFKPFQIEAIRYPGAGKTPFQCLGKLLPSGCRMQTACYANIIHGIGWGFITCSRILNMVLLLMI